MDRETLIRGLYDVADALETPPDAREACKKAAQALGATIPIHAKIKRVYVPFSGYTLATCSICREPLQTETNTCARCGAVIDWNT